MGFAMIALPVRDLSTGNFAGDVTRRDYRLDWGIWSGVPARLRSDDIGVSGFAD